MTKTAKLAKILEALDWNDDLQALENGPVTAQAIRDFDAECDWGTDETHGERLIARLEAEGVNLTDRERVGHFTNLVSLGR